MKICIINNLYPPYARGGAEQVVYRTVEGLREKGHEVILVTSTPRRDGVEEKEGLKIYRIHPKNIFFYTDAHTYNLIVRFLWHVIDIFNFSVSKQIEYILQKEKPDIVHTHNLMGLSFLIPAMIRRLYIRHVHTVHDVQLVEPSGIILKTKEKSWRYTGFATKLYTWVMKKMMGSPEVVISPSQFLLDFYASRGFFLHSHRILLRNPLTLDFKEKNKEYRIKNIENENNFDFLYLGQVEEHKGVFLLIEAFKHIANARLHIVGDGSKLEELKKEVNSEFFDGTQITKIPKTNQDNVIFHGRVERDKLSELFAQVNMTIVPSLCYENSPTVIFESLYFGVPVLASRIEGIAELIEEGKNGFTFEAGNEKSLQEKLEWCVEHKEDIEKMSIKIPTASWPEGEYIAQLLNLYEENT